MGEKGKGPIVLESEAPVESSTTEREEGEKGGSRETTTPEGGEKGVRKIAK